MKKKFFLAILGAIMALTLFQGQAISAKSKIAYAESPPQLVNDKSPVKKNKPFIEQIRATWVNRLIDKEEFSTNQYVESYTKKVSKWSEELWTSMNLSNTRDFPWDPLSSDTTSANYTTQFNHLRDLALGVKLQGTALYQNKEVTREIIAAMHFMVENKKYDGSYWTGNWWDWQIGVAHPFLDCLMLLYEDIDPAELQYLATPISKYNTDPNKQWPHATATGANLTDISLSVIGTGILFNDESRLAAVQKALPKVTTYSLNGDGLYPDGSVIQHTVFGYNGSYGSIILQGVGRIQALLLGTPWEVPNDNMNDFYNVIDKGYLQIIDHGKMPSMFSGRSISRFPGTTKYSTEFYSGKENIANLMLIKASLPQSLDSNVEKSIKKWINESSQDFDFFDNPRDLGTLISLIRIKSDQNIEPYEKRNFVNIYGAMDKVFQKSEKYSVGINMYSKRIANYESINNENKHGWHTSDGALYLYTDDTQQFDEGYWPTIDSTRIPGTTVDTHPLSDSQYQKVKSPRLWVGGSTNGTDASVGMYLDKTNEGSSLEARKSWFLLNGKIICLGAGITGESQSTIETIVENRMLSPDNTLTINGSKTSLAAGTNNQNISGWINLHGKNKNSNIGYIIPSYQSINLYIERRSGKYSEINGTVPKDDPLYTRDYLSMVASHGIAAKNDTYEYMILPGKNDADMAKIFKDKPYEVISNSKDYQSIKVGNKILTNVWKADITSNGLNYSSGSISSIVDHQTDGNIKLSFSHPAQITKSIEITVNNGIDKVISHDSDITVSENKIILQNADKLQGASRSIVIKPKIMNKKS